MNNKNVLKGHKNRESGKQHEKDFIAQCKSERLVCLKIHAGGFPILKSGGGIKYVRKPQVCDFIVIIDKMPYFIDCKTYNEKKLTMSNFIHGGGISKPSPTQNQTQALWRMYEAGYKNGGFVFVGEVWLFVSIEEIIKGYSAGLHRVKGEKIYNIFMIKGCV